jgi:transposase-like protein
VAKSIFDEPQFQTEAAAFAYVEAHLWPDGAYCPHCGECERVKRMNGKTTRIGLHKCYACKGHFTVRQGSIFESSHLPLHLWLQVIHLFCASKKGISTRQIQRMLQCSMKTAWFLGHRIREAMREGDLAPFGGGGGVVEVDETFYGREVGVEVPRGGYSHKMKVLSLVDRASGRARSHVIDSVSLNEIAPILDANMSREAVLITDEATVYRHIGWNFSDHRSVNHTRGEYVSRQDKTLHTNTVEGFFSVFKRGMIGVYQHCDKSHLHRYVAEFDFRYNYRVRLGVDDVARASKLLVAAKGKRLTYETASRQG